MYRKCTLEEVIWPRIVKTPTCWLWHGPTHKGYGRIEYQGRRLFVHRLLWEWTHGPILGGLHVLHHCDNPPCCNPAHLFLGTQADNNRDCEAKGRRPHHWGEAHHEAKLTDAIVREARRLYAEGTSCKALARKYGVRPFAMKNALTRRTWRHVD